MKKNNSDVWDTIKQNNLRAAWVATELGMYDSNFCRMMRLPLKPEKKAKVMSAIEKLAKEAVGNG